MIRTRFDREAETFERRAGLAPGAGEAIAHAIGELTPLRSSDLLLEIGPGAGEIGIHLRALPGRYAGIDLSRPMLDAFRLKPGGLETDLLLADAARAWPMAGATARIVFSSRAIHLLDPSHVAGEIARVAAPGQSVVVFGRVRREKESLRERMRRQMAALLERRGVSLGHRRRGGRAALDLLAERGAAPIEPIQAASWAVRHSARQSIESWASKPGLGGVDPPRSVKEEVLRELEQWAETQFGSLDAEIGSEEQYIIEGARLAG